MRPRKEIVLLCRDELEVSWWRMPVELREFRVNAFTSVGEACAFLESAPHCLLAMTTIPGVLGADGLAKVERVTPAPGGNHGSHAVVNKLKVLLVGVPQYPANTLAAAVETQGPELVRRAMEALRILAARKRGPKKQVPLTSVQLLRQAVIERDGVPA